MPSILLVDTQGVYRRGMKHLIEHGIADCRVSETSKIQYSDLVEPVDLIVIDSNSLDEHSVEILKDAHDRNPKMHYAFMSASKNRADILNCLSAGFHGYLHKLQSDGELISGISDLLSGRIYVPSWLAHNQGNGIGFDSLAAPSLELETVKLTRRQTEILPLLAKGMSNKEIARELQIAEGTAKAHTTAVLRALGAHNRTEAAFLAAKLVGARDGLSKPAIGRFVSLMGQSEQQPGTNGKLRT